MAMDPAAARHVLRAHVSEQLPVDAEVGVYPAAALIAGSGHAPSGSPVLTAAWDDDVSYDSRGVERGLGLEFPVARYGDGKLRPGAPYVAHTEVDGEHRCVRFIAKRLPG